MATTLCNWCLIFAAAAATKQLYSLEFLIITEPLMIISHNYYCVHGQFQFSSSSIQVSSTTAAIIQLLVDSMLWGWIYGTSINWPVNTLKWSSNVRVWWFGGGIRKISSERIKTGKSSTLIFKVLLLQILTTPSSFLCVHPYSSPKHRNNWCWA